MKTLKNVFSVLTIVLAVAALVLFFFPFGSVTLADGTVVERVGAEFAFGSDYNGGEVSQSSQVLFCGILTLATVVFSALSFKFKGTRWATLGFSIVAAVYMLVMGLSSPYSFLDTRGLGLVASATYVNAAPLLISAVLFLTFASGAAYLLIADKLEILESSEPKLPILKRIVKFLKDYKGEIKKIVWPGPKAVVKNTIIVLIMCALCGLFIWLVDLGLSALIDLIYNR